MEDIRVTRQRLESIALPDWLQSDSCGATVTFWGVVRGQNHGRTVSEVDFDGFEPLAVQSLQELAHEARAQWGEGVRALLWHRLGRIPVGERSVMIAAASKHREEAFAAARFFIEELKRRVPVWKHEFYTDGASQWLKGCALHGH